MAVVETINGDVIVAGTLFCQGIAPSAPTSGGLTDALVSATAGIQYSKLQQQATLRESIQNYGSNPVAVRKTILIVNGLTGAILSFKITVSQALASGSFNVDLLKNGTTVLSSTVAVNSTPGTGGTAYDKVAGSVTSPTLAVGDVLEINVTVSSPSGGGGAMAELIIKQDPS